MGGHVYAPDVELGPADLDAIRNSCLDYIESWYTADGERMSQCLHPDLDKRGMVRRVFDGRAEMLSAQAMTASGMAQFTELGVGRTDPEDRQFDITILAATHHIASAEVVADFAIDLLHLMKYPEGWKIVQSLWCLSGGVIANLTIDA